MSLYHLPTILSLLICIPICAQIAPSDFAPVGATWHYRDYSFDGQNPLITIISEKDTLIQSKGCRKVAVYLNSEISPATHYIFHEANRQVFFYENGSFKMLYDFNLGVGDTMYNFQPLNREYVDFTACPGREYLNVFGRSVVDSVSYLVLNGDSLKTLHFGHSGDPYFFSDVTERVGSSNGLFGRFINICPTGDDGLVRCYEDGRYFINFTGEQCNLLLSSKDVLTEFFKIFPNPVQETLSIESEMQVKEIRVFNSQGSLIYMNRSNTSISVANWVSGVYFLEISFGEAGEVVEKLIVN